MKQKSKIRVWSFYIPMYQCARAVLIYILWLKDWSATVRQEPLMMEAFGPCLPSRRQGDVFMAKVEADATI